MAVQKFEYLLVWQKSQDFTFFIYEDFSNLRDFFFKDQITRASVSISNNIAEGFYRKTNPNFMRFFNIATSSNSEVRSMLYLSGRLAYLSIDKIRDLINQSNEISKTLYGLIRSMQ